MNAPKLTKGIICNDEIIKNITKGYTIKLKVWEYTASFLNSLITTFMMADKTNKAGTQYNDNIVDTPKAASTIPIPSYILAIEEPKPCNMYLKNNTCMILLKKLNINTNMMGLNT